MRPLKGYWTFIAAALIAIGGALQTLDWTTIVSTQNAGYVLLAISGIMALLRAITSTPPAQPEHPSTIELLNLPKPPDTPYPGAQ